VTPPDPPAVVTNVGAPTGAKSVTDVLAVELVNTKVSLVATPVLLNCPVVDQPVKVPSVKVPVVPESAAPRVVEVFAFEAEVLLASPIKA
jgi:hypothetical protein